MNGLAPLRSPVALLSAFALTCALSATAVAVLAPPAHAAEGGALTITPAAGDLVTRPAFTAGEFTGSCPEAYRPGEGKPFAVHPVLEAPDGSTTTLGSKIRDLTQDGAKQRFSMEGGLNFPVGARLSPAHPQGRYAIVVRCAKSTSNNLRGQDYRVPIDVSTDGWTVAAPGAATDVQVAAESVAVPDSGEMRIKATVTVTPATLDGTARFHIGGQAVQVPVTAGKAEAVSEERYATGADVPVEVMFNPADRVANEPSTTWTTYTVTAPVPTLTASPSDTPTTGTPTGEPTDDPTDDPTGEPTEPADLDVTDEEGNVLGADPVLEAGQKVLVTARGYTENATVKAVLADSEAALPDATADAEGTVKAYAFTVPEDIADGDHTLTLTEDRTGGHSVAFAFVTGERTSPTPDPSDTAGTDSGGTTGGNTAGGTGGTTGGGTGGSGATANDPLASTGSRIAAIGLGSLALLSLGAALVIHVRRKGLLAFGTPTGH
ncbi:hypothetical protein ABT001_25925 [Streptomyces sp. NPDC002793]|uniref:hypothetical protein n=1 Tax=Streptomyces sp. NPDC002793 TaxID=3154432 RepID=UPI00331A50CF